MWLSKLGSNDVARALSAVARYTRAHVRSTNEVLAYLQRRGVSPTLSERAVAKCQAQGLLDDRVCARLWAEQWSRRGYAWAAIRLKLSTKGLDEQSIQHATRELGRASDDEARARRVVEQQVRRRAGSPARSRLALMLASRGFDADLIERVLDESLGPTPIDAER